MYWIIRTHKSSTAAFRPPRHLVTKMGSTDCPGVFLVALLQLLCLIVVVNVTQINVNKLMYELPSASLLIYSIPEILHK